METPPLIPDLTLLRRIGAGSYGDVWIARTLTGVYRAVKVVDRARFPDDRPFQRELDGISRFQRSAGHQPRQLALMHVARLEPQGLLYYVMELADDVATGTDIDPERYEPLTLKSLRMRRPVLPAAEVVRLGVELARGLTGLHGVGLIHRDVKPSNIILVNGVPKLADIGLVSSREASVTSLGTPGYSPPEGSGSLSADLWGLGRILYELVTGCNTTEFPRLPPGFDARPDAAVLLELNEVVLRACEPDPKDRYATAQQMLDELLLIQAGRSVQNLNRMRARLRTLMRVAVVAAAAALAIIAGLGVKNYFAWRALAAQEAAARRAAEEDERLARYTASLNVAQLALHTGDLGVARAALRQHVPAAGARDERGLEWFALWHESAGDAATVLGAVGDPALRTFALAPDGNTLVALRADAAGQAMAWDLATGTSRVIGDGIHYLGGFVGDGSAVIVRLHDATLRLLDLASGQFSAPQASDVRMLAAAGDGRSVVLGTPANQPVRLGVWDGVDATEISAWNPPLNAANGRILKVALSPDRRVLAVDLESNTGVVGQSELLVWDLVAQSYRFRSTAFGRITALQFSPDAARLLVAASDAPTRVVDATTGAPLVTLTEAPPYLSAASFSAGGAQLACATHDGRIMLFDLGTGAALATLRGHESFIEALTWSGDGRLVSASVDGTVRVWTLPVVPQIVVRDGFWRETLGHPVFSRDGNVLVSTLADGRLSRVDGDTLAPVGVPWAAFQALGFADEGLRALDASRALVVIDPETNGVASTSLRLEGTGVLYVAAASSDAGTVLLGQADGAVTLWDTSARRTIVRSSVHQHAVTAGAVAADGSRAVTGDRGGAVWVWDGRAGRALRELPGKVIRIQEIAVSPDGQRAAVCTGDGEIGIWQLATGEREATIMTHGVGHGAARFSPDGTRLITAGRDGLTYVWSVPGFRQLATLSFLRSPYSEGSDSISSLVIAPDGRALVALTESGHLRRWNLQR